MPNGNHPQPTVLPPTRYSTDNCTSVSEFCPVQFTIYGYFPSLGANAFFCAFFGICAFLHFVFGLRWKTWTYMIALTFGCIGECLGKKSNFSTPVASH